MSVQFGARQTTPTFATSGTGGPGSQDTATSLIITLTQSNTACPSSRSCPGVVALKQLCTQNFSNFECVTSWDSGMQGALLSQRKDLPTIEESVETELDVKCDKCANSMDVVSIRENGRGPFTS